MEAGMSDTEPIKYSILMTVFDREPEVLLSTFRSLLQCDLSGVELIVVNDCSNMSYSFAKAYLQAKFPAGGWHDMEPYRAFRLEDGSNNPARAFNRAVQLSKGENLILMSSDVMVPPRTLERLRRIDLSETLWTPFVEDTHGHLRGEYCGPNRLMPMPWFLGCSRAAMYAVKGWDERYLRGLCYEDNDLVARLALHTGRFMGDWGVKVFHQGHYQVAYDADVDLVITGNKLNRELTMEKWTGIPFDAEYTPFDVLRKMHKSGNVHHECVDHHGKLDAAVSSTEGLLAESESFNAVLD